MQLTPEQVALEKKFKLEFDKIKIALMQKPDTAFFTSVFFSLKHRIHWGINTLATDGVTVYINPGFFMSLTRELQLSACIHETEHVVLEHCGVDGRLGQRDPELFNFAADYVINLHLKQRGFQIDPNWLLDERFNGMFTEQVYAILEAEKKQGAPQPTNGLGKDIQPAPADMSPEQMKRHIEDIIVRAAVQSKQAGDKPGTIPGDIQIYLDKLLNPKLPWQQILARFVQAKAKNDYSWRIPNRRYFPEHHLPSLYSEKVDNLTIAVDASGSVSDSDFKRFISEITGIFKMMMPNKITLIQFDTEIIAVDNLHSLADLARCKFSGRGGTDITPVMKWAAQNKPEVLLFFTDGEFDFPAQNYESKRTLWLIHENQDFTAPYGKVIHYEMT